MVTLITLLDCHTSESFQLVNQTENANTAYSIHAPDGKRETGEASNLSHCNYQRHENIPQIHTAVK